MVHVRHQGGEGVRPASLDCQQSCTNAERIRSLKHLCSAFARLLCATLAIYVLLLVLPGCGGSDGSTSAPTQAEAATAKKKPKASSTTSDGGKATGAAYTMPDEVTVPTMESTTSSAIDTSGVASGYVGAAAQSPCRLKFQVRCGEMTYNYDMPNDGSPAFFPLNMGNGSYAFRIMENIEGSDYAELDAVYTDVSLSSEFAPFIVPNIFCNYTGKSDCVKQARSVAGKASNEGEVVRDVCTYVANTVSYDYDKAKQLAQSTGYIPNPDATLKSKTGICFDYASLTAAMLRSLGMPTKVITGYVSPNDLYHAWIMVYADGTWQTALFSIKPNTWSRCDVTFASAGESDVTGSGTTYTDRYTY